MVSSVNLVLDMIWGRRFIFPVPFLKRPSFPLVMWHLCHKLLLWSLFQDLSSVSLLSIRPTALCCPNYRSFQKALTSGRVSPSALLLFKNALFFINFRVNFRISLSISKQNNNNQRKACWDFDQNYMEPRVQIWENWPLYKTKCRWVCTARAAASGRARW